MSIPFTRRTALATPVLLASALFFSRAQAADKTTAIEARLRELEMRSGGRLGVAVLDTATGRLTGNLIDEHFAMCSTFKALAVAFVLSRVDAGKERLDRRIFFTDRDLVMPFKATKPHIGSEGMTIAELCEAAVTVSDSTAANLLLASFGGPRALTTYMRSLGDQVTHLDRTEPELNIVKPGETHDTTSPRAMAYTLRRIVLGDALSASSRSMLTSWMAGARDVATQRLRVGLPAGWRIANKPGTWVNISTNDVGVIWPPGQPPIVVTAFLGEASTSPKTQDGILADVARIVAEQV
jgi:beta-lactamase class A